VLFNKKILYYLLQFLSYPEEQSMRLQTIVVRVARLTAPATSGMPLQVSQLVNHVYKFEFCGTYFYPGSRCSDLSRFGVLVLWCYKSHYNLHLITQKYVIY